jgi:hypothetical protein
LTEVRKGRHEVVKTIFPQIAYLISNIVVLVDKQPPHHTGYAEKLTKFAELSTVNSGTGEKPFLIVIQNFVSPELLESGSTTKTRESLKIERSTADFHECIGEQKKTEELLQHYRDICFIRLPSWATHPALFDQQICLLQVRYHFHFSSLKLSLSLTTQSISLFTAHSSDVLQFFGFLPIGSIGSIRGDIDKKQLVCNELLE